MMGNAQPYEWEHLRLKYFGLSEMGYYGSPFRLIQEEVLLPWEGVVGAMMQQRTTRRQAHPATWEVLITYRNPDGLSKAVPSLLAEMIKPCGFQNKRAIQLIAMSEEWLRGARPVNPGNVTGCGPYVCESYRIFALDDYGFEPDDNELQRYVDWRRRQ